MPGSVLVIGGYGNFGGRIARALAAAGDIRVIVGGRSLDRAREKAAEISGARAAEGAAIDIDGDFGRVLAALRPAVVVHTSGPFQAQDYRVARTCIELGIHYIDLADGRAFVAGIGALDDAARRRDVAVISGASSLPCLSAALVDHYRGEFRALERLDYGIATAQKYRPGPATTGAILAYLGRPFTTRVDGRQTLLHGWQGLRRRRFRHLGGRWLGDCDLPDLALFPRRYPELQTIRFGAGIEPGFAHLALWCLAGMARLGLPRRPERLAPALHRLARLFERAGSEDSAFFLHLTGTGPDEARRQIRFELTARHGDGQQIPCVPAILLARRLVRGEPRLHGAAPCLGMIALADYLRALGEWQISWQES